MGFPPLSQLGHRPHFFLSAPMGWALKPSGSPVRQIQETPISARIANPSSWFKGLKCPQRNPQKALVVNIYALRYLGSWDRRTPGWPGLPRETLSLIQSHTHFSLSSHSCRLGGWTALLCMSWLLTLWLWVNAKSDEICQVSFYTVKFIISVFSLHLLIAWHLLN